MRTNLSFFFYRECCGANLKYTEMNTNNTFPCFSALKERIFVSAPMNAINTSCATKTTASESTANLCTGAFATRWSVAGDSPEVQPRLEDQEGQSCLGIPVY